MVEVEGSKLKKFVVKHFLPLGFVVGVVFAMVWDVPGHYLYGLKVNGWKIISTINIAIVMLIFGLCLETSELKTAFKSVKALSLGLFSILFLTALTAFLFTNVGFQPPEFGIGLAIFACSPTSLSQSITIVIQSYGNGALALLYTVATNLLGIVVSPLTMAMVLGPAGEIDKIDLLIKLVVQILIPLVVGKLLRDFVPPVLHFAVKYKVPLYLFNNFQIIMIVWQTLSYSRHKLLEQEPYDIILAIMGAIGQHFLFLVMNFIIAWAMRLKEAERKAYVISSSQKSLPTAAVLIEAINNPALNAGLMTIPCMVFYVMQLFIDSFIATSWAGKFERADQLRAKYATELAELYKLDDPESAMFLHGPEHGKAAVTAQQDALQNGSDDKQGLLSGIPRS